MATKHKSVRFEEDVLAVYAEQAEADGRTVSNLINFALRTYAKQMGWILPARFPVSEPPAATEPAPEIAQAIESVSDWGA